jgi:hypothetical protein
MTIFRRFAELSLGYLNAKNPSHAPQGCGAESNHSSGNEASSP